MLPPEELSLLELLPLGAELVAVPVAESVDDADILRGQ